MSLGGPIVRDRMHFFFSYEANDQDREETVSLGGNFQSATALRQQLSQYVGTFKQPFRCDLAFGKVSYQPGSQSALSISAGSIARRRTSAASAVRPAIESAEDVKNDVWGLTGRHQYTASSWFNEFSLSFLESKWNPQPLNPDLVGFEYEGLLRIGGRDTEQRIGQERLSFRDDVTLSNLQWVRARTR